MGLELGPGIGNSSYLGIYGPHSQRLFCRGMSGAQFVRGEDYDAVTGALREPDDHTVWLNGTDPALVWGKVLELPENVDFWQWPEQRWP